MKRIIFLAAVLMLLSFRCNKDADIIIDGFTARDFAGNYLGQFGGADDDWTLQPLSSLASYEQQYLIYNNDWVKPPVGQASNVTIGSPIAYPNPCNQVLIFSATATDSVKVNLVMIDAEGAVAASTAVNFKGTKYVQFDVSDRNKFLDKKAFRLLYSFSTQSNLNFKAGHGDIKVCSSSNGTTTTVNSCF